MSNKFVKQEVKNPAAIGQAYNLASNEEFSKFPNGNNEYFLHRFLFHLERAKMCQGLDPKNLEIALNNPTFVAKLRDLDNELSV